MSRKFIAHFVDPKGILIANNQGNGIFAEGTTVPTDATSGYAVGCIFVHNDGSDGGQLYVNEGSATSCDFNALQSEASAVFELGFSVFPHASATEWDLWVAPFSCQVTSIKYVPSTLQGGAMTATVVKAVSTATPVKTTTPMVTADVIDLNAGAYTVVTPTLTATTADLQLAVGNRISLDFSAAPTAAIWALSISLKRLN